MPCGLHTGWVYDDDVRVLNASGGAVGTRWEYAEWDITPPKLLNSTDERFITCLPPPPPSSPPLPPHTHTHMHRRERDGLIEQHNKGERDGGHPHAYTHTHT